MNLFWLHPNIRLCVYLYCDAHVVKMLLESTQLMNNVYHVYGQPSLINYRFCHQGHPCTIWTAQSLRHFQRVGQLALAIAREYFRRYQKHHKCWRKVMLMLSQPPTFREHQKPAFKPTTTLASMGPFDDVPLCFGEHTQFFHKNACVAYRRYYLWKIVQVPKCRQWNLSKMHVGHMRALLACDTMLPMEPPSCAMPKRVDMPGAVRKMPVKKKMRLAPKPEPLA